MGIPKFFSNIFKKYPETHFVDKKFVTDVLLLDYNSFIYAYREYFKQTTYDKFKKLAKSKREEKIIDFVIKRTLDFVNNVVKPRKMLYIAIDGPAPRGKINEQRFRRYKAAKKDIFIDELNKEFNQKNINSLFTSVNISPGTSFMTKLSDAIWKAINAKKFMNGKIKVIFSDSSVPGEGEHKILPYLRSLKNSKEHIVLFSPDADMIVLGLQVKGDIYLIKEKDKRKDHEMKFYPNEEYFMFSYNKYKEFLQKELEIYNDTELFNDIVLLTFFMGNDFLKPIPFIRSNIHRSFETVIAIYKNLYKKHKKFLVEIKDDIPSINQAFFRDLIYQLSQKEDYMMKKYYNDSIIRNIQKEVDPRKYVENISYDEKISSYEHGVYYLPYTTAGNPRSEEYKIFKDNPNYREDLYKAINYNLPVNEWKKQYYTYYFDIDSSNPKEYRDYRKLICMKYLEGLVYVLKYYLVGVPSWKWYYPFRATPLPSDILYFMKNESLDFKFNKDTPYTPLQQLMMILPLRYKDLLPRKLQSIITDLSYSFYPYYPNDFNVDFLLKEKFIYSEPLLPDYNDKLFNDLNVKKIFEDLGKTNKNRNKLVTEPRVFEP